MKRIQQIRTQTGRERMPSVLGGIGDDLEKQSKQPKGGKACPCCPCIGTCFFEFFHVEGKDILSRFKRLSIMICAILIALLYACLLSVALLLTLADYCYFDISTNNYHPGWLDTGYIVHISGVLLFNTCLFAYFLCGKSDLVFTICSFVIMLVGAVTMTLRMVGEEYSMDKEAAGLIAFVGVACYGSLLALTWPFQLFFYIYFVLVIVVLFLRELVFPTNPAVVAESSLPNRLFKIGALMLPTILPFFMYSGILLFYLRLKDFSELLLATTVRSIARMNWDTSPVVMRLQEKEAKYGFDSLLDLEKSLLLIIRNLSYMRSYMDPSLMHALEQLIDQEEEKKKMSLQERKESEHRGADARRDSESGLSISTLSNRTEMEGAVFMGGRDVERLQWSHAVVFDVHVSGVHRWCVHQRDEPINVSKLFETLISIVSGAVESRNGIAHSFLSDGIVASFNSHLKPCKHPEEAAVECAWDIQERLMASDAFSPVLHLRMSAVSGQLLLGEVGNKELRRFSLLGSTVQIASSINRFVEWNRIAVPFDARTSIVFDQAVLKHVHYKFDTRPIEVFVDIQPVELKLLDPTAEFFGWVKTFHCVIQKRQLMLGPRESDLSREIVMVDMSDCLSLANRFISILRNPDLDFERNLRPAIAILHAFLSLEDEWSRDVRQVVNGHLTGTGTLNEVHLLASFARAFQVRGKQLQVNYF